jgi:tetratricopeptide (TPR) repeat protein
MIANLSRRFIWLFLLGSLLSGLPTATRAQFSPEKQTRFLEMVLANQREPALLLLREMVEHDSTAIYRLADAAESIIFNDPTRTQAPLARDIELLQRVFEQSARYDPAGPGEWYLRKAVLTLKYPGTFAGREREIISRAVLAKPFDCPLELFERWMDAEIADYKANRFKLGQLMGDWRIISELLQSRMIRHQDPNEPAGQVQLNMLFELRKLVPDCERMADIFRNDPTSLDCPGFLTLYDLQSCIAQDRLWLDAFDCALQTEDAAYIYRLAAEEDLNHQDYIHAEANLQKAIEREEDAALRASDCLNLADIYALNGEYEQAEGWVKQAIEHMPNWGRPYLRLGELYIEGSPSCELSDFEAKVVYWLASDLCREAKIIDPSVSLEADRRLFRYRLNQPSAKDIVAQNLKSGSNYSLGCWINKATRVRID